MTTKETNKIVNSLFNKWKKEFKNYNKIPTSEYYKKLDEFEKECLKAHNIVGFYESISYKNALKMASICSGIRFTPPWQMLMYLEKTLKVY
jgi:hypothetical protein